MPITRKDAVKRHSNTLTEYEYDPVLGVVTVPAGRDDGISAGFNPHVAGPVNVVTTDNQIYYFDPTKVTNHDILRTIEQSDNPEDTYRLLGSTSSPLAKPRLPGRVEGTRVGLDGLRLELDGKQKQQGDDMTSSDLRKLAQDLGVNEQDLQGLITGRGQQSPQQATNVQTLPPIQPNYPQQQQPNYPQQQPNYSQQQPNYPQQQPQQFNVPPLQRFQPEPPPSHMGRGDRAVAVDSIEVLNIPFLSSAGPTSPNRVIVVDGGPSGKFSIAFHDIIERANHIILVRDTRHVGSVSWLPPERGETPMRLSVQQPTGDYTDYTVLSLGYDFRFGVFDMVFLPVVDEPASQMSTGEI